MTTVQYPSVDFPGQPALAIEVPEGWAPFPGAGLPLAVAAEVPEGQFRPTVIVSISRIRPGHTLQEAIDQVLAGLTTAEGYSEVGREEREIAGFPGFRIEGAFRDARVGTITQAVRIAYVDHGEVADLIQITGTCTGEQAQQLWPAVRAIQDSLTITK
jgi:hypothetical protein